jgi:hypothetical protein
MDCSDWFLSKWKDSAVGVEAVINPCKFFQVSSDAMWFAELCSACNNARKFS